MGNQMRPQAAVSEIHQMKPRCTRGKGEVCDADEVAVADAVVMPLQCIQRASKQIRSHLAVDALRSSEREPGACGTGSKGGKRKIDKKTAGNYQDIELRCI